MGTHKTTNQKIYTGRISGKALYLHEKVKGMNLDKISSNALQKAIAVVGYACDEGVKRNQGRVGAVTGPDAIRAQLGKMPNHLRDDQQFLDFGTIACLDGDMEEAQKLLSKKIFQLLNLGTFPIVLGGGHDLAYGHYKGIRKYVGNDNAIGIINFDAHFDLRSNIDRNNSGTPFFQIACEYGTKKNPFKYLCLGIRKDANDRVLFDTANDLGVGFIGSEIFNMSNSTSVLARIDTFVQSVDSIYMTIDLDGFSSAYAPGVSAPSPMGFSPDIVLQCLKAIVDSKKLISMDVAEMNPEYDIDGQTAKLAASLVHFVMHNKWH